MYLLKIKKISLFCMISLLASSNASYVTKTKESAKELVKKIETLCDQAKKNKKTVALATAACSLAALEVYGLLKMSGTDTSYARRFGHGILFGAGHLLNKLSPSLGSNLFSFEKNMLVGEEFVISKLQAILAMLVGAVVPANSADLDNMGTVNAANDLAQNIDPVPAQDPNQPAENQPVQVQEAVENTQNLDAQPQEEEQIQNNANSEEQTNDNPVAVAPVVIENSANSIEKLVESPDIASPDLSHAPTNLQQMLENDRSSREESDTESVSSRSSAVSITIDNPDHKERKEDSSDSNLSPKTSQSIESESDSSDSEKIYAQKFKDPTAYADDLKTRIDNVSAVLFGVKKDEVAEEKTDATTINIPAQDSQIINTQLEVIELQPTSIAQEANVENNGIFNKISNYVVGDFNLGNFSL